jgi:ureidoglycolate lyase
VTLRALPLTAADYAPYGDVVMASPHGEVGAPANQGTAERWGDLTRLRDLRPGRALLSVSVFRCSPRLARPIPVVVLEKHPASTQLFVPMNARRYLVVVALGQERPDLGTLAAFVANGAQAVSYAPGVWHHPMIALDAEIDFACFVYQDGSADDCVEIVYEPSEQRFIIL